MPGFTTHYIFGMKAYNDMPFTPLKHTIAKYRWLYQLGLQGPDMFFYNIPILRHRDYRNVGSYMHEHKVNAFFECCLRRIGTIRSRQQQEEAISYLAGFMNHYIADSICHPYVYGRIGYPVMLKAASGGGGKGIRVAESVKDLKDAYDSASAEAIANFGDGRLYMEKYIHNPRHIEVQILGDNYGNVVHLFERECSVQRRHQKLIEESPSAFVTPELREKMTSAAVALAKRVGYRNAGTIEFLVDNDRNFYFCEMNTRIQVEHPVTEEVTGVDLVCEQLRVAAGEPLSFKQEDLTIRGHAIECRINAEDPSRNFAPCPGTLVSLHLPGGPGVRVDSAAYQGYKIPPFYDSMIGKLIVYGADREQAIVRMRRALAEMLFEGVVTATDYQMHILCSKAFVEANFNVNSIANGDFD